MNRVIETLRAAQTFTAENPELHAEYERRRAAGEWFKDGEPVTDYMRRLLRLNDAAARACW